MAFKFDRRAFKKAYEEYRADSNRGVQNGRIRPKGVDIFDWLKSDKAIYEAAAREVEDVIGR